MERAAVEEYLKSIGAVTLDKSRYRITDDIVETDIDKFSQIENAQLERRP